MTALSMRLLPAPDYYDALIKNLPAAKERIVIHAMEVMWGPKTAKLLPMLYDALKRGVEVRIVGDRYTEMQAKLPRFVRSSLPWTWQQISETNERLQAKGATVTYVGKLLPNPYKGRCHSKITLIDDLVYTFGGINFIDNAFDNHDYMLELRNAQLADSLYNLVREIEEHPRLTDITRKLDEHATLLFDGGNPGSSPIYETACEVVANARKVYFVSQMCPSGRLAEKILATENYCYFISASQAEVPANAALLFDKLRYGITNYYKGDQYIHAKFILCEGKDGSKHVVSGSNNFSWRGIAYGTKEIAVHSTDPALYDVFFDYLQGIIHES